MTRGWSSLIFNLILMVALLATGSHCRVFAEGKVKLREDLYTEVFYFNDQEKEWLQLLADQESPLTSTLSPKEAVDLAEKAFLASFREGQVEQGQIEIKERVLYYSWSPKTNGSCYQIKFFYEDADRPSKNLLPMKGVLIRWDKETLVQELMVEVGTQEE